MSAVKDRRSIQKSLRASTLAMSSPRPRSGSDDTGYKSSQTLPKQRSLASVGRASSKTSVGSGGTRSASNATMKSPPLNQKTQENQDKKKKKKKKRLLQDPDEGSDEELVESEDESDVDSMQSQTDSDADSELEVEIALDERGVPQVVKKTKPVFDDHGNLLRRFLYLLLVSKYFKGLILSVIIINGIVVTVQTSKDADAVVGYWMSVLDNIFLSIYITEIVLKLYVFRLQFFKSSWNLFDLFIVITSFFEWLDFLLIASSSFNFNPKTLRLLRVLRAFRALRALRVLRTVSVLKNLQVIIVSLLRSIPAMGGVVILLYMVLYFFVIVGRQRYGDSMPDRFGNMWITHFSLFQLLTLDDWFMFYDEGREENPDLIIYLVAFIVMETFIFINLFVAVIVDNLERYQRKLAKRRLKKSQKKKDKLIKLKKSVKLRTKVTNMNEDSDFDDDPDHMLDNEQSARLEELTKKYCLYLASIDKNSETVFRQDYNINMLMSLSSSQENQLR